MEKEVSKLKFKESNKRLRKKLNSNKLNKFDKILYKLDDLLETDKKVIYKYQLWNVQSIEIVLKNDKKIEVLSSKRGE